MKSSYFCQFKMCYYLKHHILTCSLEQLFGQLFCLSFHLSHFKISYYSEPLHQHIFLQPFGQHFSPFIFYIHFKYAFISFGQITSIKGYYFFHLHFYWTALFQILFVCFQSLTYFQMCPFIFTFKLACDTV